MNQKYSLKTIFPREEFKCQHWIDHMNKGFGELMEDLWQPINALNIIHLYSSYEELL